MESPKLIDFTIITVNVTDREGAEFAKLALLEYLAPTLAPYRVAIVMTHSKFPHSTVVIRIFVIVAVVVPMMMDVQGRFY